MNFREAPGQVVDWFDTGRSHFSNFRYLDEYFQYSPVLRRIFSLARKLGYQSLLVEQILERDSDLLALENADLKIAQPNFSQSLVLRLSFWLCPKGTPNPEDHFLGYAVVKMDHFDDEEPLIQHVYESVLKQPRTSQENNFVHCEKKFTVNTAIGKCTVKGVLYAQQNRRTFACAHVALRTILTSTTGEDISYHEINMIAGMKPVQGKEGLDPPEIEAVLSAKSLSFGTIRHRPHIKKDGEVLKYPGEFQRDLYGFIESGAPAMLGFEVRPRRKQPSNHVIPVFGHTFNDDTWVPEAKKSYFPKAGAHYSSEAWLSAYIAHDDNFGPYFCLPRHFLQKRQFRLLVGINRFPTKMHAVDVETVAFDYLKHMVKALPPNPCGWYRRLNVYVSLGIVVLRTLMVSRQEYVWHIRNLECYDGLELEDTAINELEAHLPEYFWMVEVAAPELFSTTRRKFGDVLFSAKEAIPKTYSSVLAARLPGTVVRMTDKGFEATRTEVIGHSTLIKISGV